ncbi:MFS transporter [Neisseriaceae bacterium B1]
MNMNKVYFYIAALAILIGGVWASLPSDEQRAKMQAAAQKRKAEKIAKQKSAQQKITSAPVASNPQ